jgi:threonine dehydrogenase-like Zn-dependent dehydrogenase
LVDDVPEPRPGPGQLLLEPIATGICGSDLSAWQHTADFLQASLDSDTATFVFDPDQDLVMGHEFSARVIELGEGVTGYAVGDQIVALPVALDSDGVHRCVGYSTQYPGALGTRVVVQAEIDGHPLHPHIPEGLDPFLAALTEPLTVGFNAVARSRIGTGSATGVGAVVIGCGPVGLAALIGLVERGISPIVVSDPSAARRAMATDHGAHAVIDPATEEPIAAWQAMAAPGQRLYVYENTGVKGMINRLMYAVPWGTRILISGSCMVDDTIRPVVGIYKNLRLDFCMGPDMELGPTEDEFRLTLQRLADGDVDGRRLVTGWTSLSSAREAFEALRPRDAHSIDHFKILVRHDLDRDGIVSPEELGVL